MLILDPDVDYSIVIDGDNDDLICNSKLVISSLDFSSFKSIQLGIPTVLIEGVTKMVTFHYFMDSSHLIKNK